MEFWIVCIADTGQFGNLAASQFRTILEHANGFPSTTLKVFDIAEILVGPALVGQIQPHRPTIFRDMCEFTAPPLDLMGQQWSNTSYDTDAVQVIAAVLIVVAAAVVVVVAVVLLVLVVVHGSPVS